MKNERKKGKLKNYKLNVKYEKQEMQNKKWKIENKNARWKKTSCSQLRPLHCFCSKLQSACYL